MNELFSTIIAAVGQCGVLSSILFGGLVFQTIRIGRREDQIEKQWRQIVDDAVARTKTAESYARSQQELVMLLTAHTKVER